MFCMGGSVGGSLDVETNIEARYRTQTYNFYDISLLNEMNFGFSTLQQNNFFPCSKPTYWVLGSHKIIFCSLLTQYFIYFLNYFTIYIEPLTFNLSKLGRPSWALFFVLSSLTQNFTKSFSQLTKQPQ